MIDTGSIRERAARLLEKIGNLQEAVDQYTENLKDSKCSGYHIERGDLYQRMHQPKLAVADYTAALAFVDEMKEPNKDRISGKEISDEPIGATVYQKRARAYLAMGKSDLAAADKESATRINSARLTTPPAGRSAGQVSQ